MASENYAPVLDAMTWSFSRVNTYCQCPHQFKLCYLDRKKQTDNAFGQWGSFCHSIFERYLKGQIELFELADVYEREYFEKVTLLFPSANFMDLDWYYYDKGLSVFSSFNGLPDNLEFIASEQKVFTKINGRNFIGYIDVVLRDKADGGLIIQDFKSKKAFKSKKEQAHYALQPYLYSHYIKEKYGVYPKMLRFDMFRVGKIVDIPFVEKDFKKADEWFTSTIDSIYSDKEFKANYDEFFCKNLCGVRGYCDVCKEMNGKQKEG